MAMKLNPVTGQMNLMPSAADLAVAGGHLASQGRPGASFNLLQKLKTGQDGCVMICSDSTGVDVNATASWYWPHKLALKLGAMFPTHTVLYYQNPTSVSFPAPTVLQVGTGPGVLRFYNGAISGTNPWYLQGSSFQSVFVTNLVGVPDLIIMNHGKNFDYTQSVQIQSAVYQAAMKQFTDIWPEAGVIICRQYPDPIDLNYPTIKPWTPNTAYALNDIILSGFRAYKATVGGVSGANGSTAPKGTGGSYVDGSVTWAYQGGAQQQQPKAEGASLAAALNGWDVADFNGAFAKNGWFAPNMFSTDAATLFANTVHASQIGDDVAFDPMARLFENVTSAIPRPKLDGAINLLANSNFQLVGGAPVAQSAGATVAPDGWVGNNAALTQYTTAYENSGNFALKVASVAVGPAWASGVLSGAAIRSLRGKWVTLLARLSIGQVADTVAGSIELLTNGGGSNRTPGMTATGGWWGGYIWYAVSGRLSTTETSITVNLYGAKGAAAAIGTYAIFDHVVLVPGLLIRDAPS